MYACTCMFMLFDLYFSVCACPDLFLRVCMCVCVCVCVYVCVCVCVCVHMVLTDLRIYKGSGPEWCISTI